MGLLLVLHYGGEKALETPKPARLGREPQVLPEIVVL